MFNDMNVNFYFLEYDNDRAGSFAPLAHVPRGKTVVLGLVSSHSREVETADYLKRRIEEATAYIGLNQLALSPQCGFSTGAAMSDNGSIEIEAAKLARIVAVAKDVWGD